ncbi:MAG: hypothetical protein JNM56_22605 [Planctomycetia bacterium]|nr:hypothetical protein [Planctomycetia bacterium]
MAADQCTEGKKKGKKKEKEKRGRSSFSSKTSCALSWHP